MRPILLCLHGWGSSGKISFAALREALRESDIEILAPDLPGFGDEPEPSRPWTNDDYAEWVETYIEKKNPSSFALLGHSHGGRIAIKLATRGHLKIDHLFLCASAGIRHPKHIRRALGFTLAKTGRLFLSIPGFKKLQPLGKRLLYKFFRVHDYEKARPVMRKTMIKVSREDLKPLLKQIKIPTDIFWGERDPMTPLSDAFMMERAIPNAILHTYPNVRHRPHREKTEEVAEVIGERLQSL